MVSPVRLRVICLALVLTGCANAAVRESVPLVRFAYPWQVLAGTAAHDTVHRFVVRSDEDWRQLHTQFGVSEVPAPPMNLDSMTVLVATLGSFEATGPWIKIDSAARTGRMLEVYVTAATCDGPWFGGFLVVHPVDALAVRRHRGPVVFRERAVAFDGCFSGKPQ